MKRKLYVASVMARDLAGQYTHRALYTRQRSRLAAKNWFSRRVEDLFPSEEGWGTSTLMEEVPCK